MFKVEFSEQPLELGKRILLSKLLLVCEDCNHSHLFLKMATKKLRRLCPFIFAHIQQYSIVSATFCLKLTYLTFIININHFRCKKKKICELIGKLDNCQMHGSTAAYSTKAPMVNLFQSTWMGIELFMY